MLRRIALVLATSAFAVACSSPPKVTTGSISGKVIVTGADTNSAMVSVLGQMSATASDGTFTLEALPVGTVKVTASREGYKSASVDVEVLAAETVAVELTLSMENLAPSVISVSSTRGSLARGQTAELFAQAVDPNGDTLAYTWSSDNAAWTVTAGANGSASVQAPLSSESLARITVSVDDGHGATASGFLVLVTNANQAPMLSSLVASPPQVSAGGSVTLMANASDADGDALTYDWTVPSGWTVVGTVNAQKLVLTAPNAFSQTAMVTLTVADDQGASATATALVSTLPNQAPLFNSVSASPSAVVPGGVINLFADAVSPVGNALTYSWVAPSGWTLSSSTGASVQLTAPSLYGDAGLVEVTAADSYGKQATARLVVATVPNGAPLISSVVALPSIVAPGGMIALSVSATDPNGDPLSYTWAQADAVNWALSSTGPTATLTAPSTYGASTTVTVVVQDGTGAATQATVAVSTAANRLPLISSLVALPAQSAPGAAVSITASAMDPDGDSLTYSWTSSNPANWPVPTGAGTSFTVTAPGSYDESATYTLTVSDGHGGTATSSVAVSTAQNRAPALTALWASPSSTVAPASSLQLSATAEDLDGDSLTYAWTSSDAANWPVPTGAGASFSLTAPSVYGSSATFTVLVSDGQGGSTTSSIVLATSPNHAPSITSLLSSPSTATAPGGLLTLRVLAEDVDGDPLNYAWSTSDPTNWPVPTGGGASLSITAPSAYGSSATFTVVVSDGQGGSTTSSIVLSTGANGSPSISSLTAQPAITGVNGVISVAVAAGDPDGNPLTYSWSSSDPVNWPVSAGSSATKSVTAPNLYGSSATLTVTVFDGNGGSATSSVVVGTTANAAPQISAFNAVPSTLSPGASSTLSISASDANGDALGYAWSVSGSGWTLSGASPTSRTLTAPSAHDSVATVTVVVSDGYGGSTTSSINVATTPNTAPVISSLVAAPASLARNGSSTVQASVSEPDGEPLSYNWSVTPSSWTLSGSGSSVSLTAPNSYASTATVTLVVSDGMGGSAESSVVVATVANADPVVSALSAQPSTLAPSGSSAVSISASDPNGDSLSYSWSVSGAGWTLSGASPTSRTLVAPNAHSSLATVTVVVTDGFGGTSSSTLNVATTPNAIPTIATFTASPNPAPIGGSTTLVVSAVEPDGEPLSYSWVSSNAAQWPLVSVDSPTLTLTGPTAADVASLITVTVTDSHGASAQATVQVATQGDQAPQIISAGLSNAEVRASRRPSTYSSFAFDPDGDAITWSLGNDVPPGATIDANTGLFSWKPTVSQVGQSYAPWVFASDGIKQVYQMWSVTAAPFQLDVHPANPSPMGGCISGAGTGDLDGDGIEDVLVTDTCNWPNRLRTHFMTAGGTIRETRSVDVNNDCPNHLAVGELDGNAGTDVAVLYSCSWPSSYFGVFTNDGAGNLTFSNNYMLPYGNPRMLEIADVDNDGSNDVLVGHDTGLTAPQRPLVLLTSDGAGGFNAPVPVAGNDSDCANNFLVRDFDGDGNVDIAHLANCQSALVLWEGDGAGNFTEVLRDNSMWCTWSSPMMAGQVDNSGGEDVVVLPGCGGPTAYLNNSTPGSFAFNKVTSSASGLCLDQGQRSATLVDLDLDGRLDVMAPNGCGSSRAALLGGDGAGSFSTSGYGDSLIPFERRLMCTDFDGDGASEVVSINNSNSDIYVHY